MDDSQVPAPIPSNDTTPVHDVPEALAATPEPPTSTNGRDDCGIAASSVAAACGPDYEVIDGYRVHPDASVIPKMPDDQFDGLVDSIAERGLGEPIEFHGEELVDGRHRLRAILRLREQGISVEIRKQQWQPLGDETVAEYVRRKNADRRHLTDAQRIQCAAVLLSRADKERRERDRGAGRIQRGEVRNPTGRNQRSVPREEGETDAFPAPDSRSQNRRKTERSAAGRLAKQEKTTIHRARQAIKVNEHGTQEEIADVKGGRKTPLEVIKQIDERRGESAARRPEGPKRIEHPFTPQTPLQSDLLNGWIRLQDNKVAVNERRQARADMRLILDAEEEAEASLAKSRCPRGAGSKKRPPGETRTK